jgi:LPS-assembly protein
MLLLPGVAAAQYRAPAQHFPTINTNAEPITGNQPVTFQADSVTYDRDHGLVSAEGHVEAWQNDHVLRADRVTFDRNTNVAAAYGHVVIVEPDGQVLFADYAELTQGMRNGVLTGMRALLAQNGRLAANGARRTEGRVNEMTRGVYSTCNVCALDPQKAPLWQLRARLLTQDLENKRIEYQDATLDFLGFPVLYLPYFSNSDPSVKRQSGLLAPTIGATDSHLGSYIALPYYLVLDGQSDLTLTPLLATRTGPQLETTYRRDFNAGVLRIDGAIARDTGADQGPGQTGSDKGIQGYVFTHGLFDWNDTWRYGFDINLASSTDYLRDFHVPGYGTNVLTSTIFVEGFGVGSYAKLDVRSYQGLDSSINQSLLPYVLPRFQYSFVGGPDLLGGRLSFDTTEFNITRDEGTNDQRLGARLQWDRLFTGALGERWLLTAQGVAAAYGANVANGQPNYLDRDVVHGVHGQAQVALKVNWPFVRATDGGGSQVIEPIVQLIAAPQSGNAVRDNIPNEDSLNYEFTDSTLFELNRFGGYDRFDGGARANFALRAEWNFPAGQKLEGLVGASWQQHIDHDLYPQFQPWNGFETGQHLSDIVMRGGYVPNKLFDVMARGRVDPDRGDIRFAEAIANAGVKLLRVNAGYIYSSTNPYGEYLQNFNLPGYFNPLNPNPIIAANPKAFFTPRQEVTAGFSTTIGNYTLSADARRNIENGQLDSIGANAKYENECFAFDIYAARRFTAINYDSGDTTILFTITLKTVGAFGVNG